MKSTYEGYVWMSDETRPKILRGEEIDLKLSEGENPFIIEAQLVDKTADKSISIRYIDGKYIVKEYALDKLKNEPEKKNLSTIKYIPTLSFVRLWREEPDPLCEGMTTQVPGPLVFTGFADNK